MRAPALGNPSEQRAHQRVEVAQPVAVKIPSWTPLPGHCLDISHGGLRLQIHQRVQVGDHLVFKADLPGSETSTLGATVCHVSDLHAGRFEIGMKWLDADAKTVCLFETIVRDHLPAPPRPS